MNYANQGWIFKPIYLQKIVKQSKQDILDQSKDNEIENLFDDINMSNSGVYYYIKIDYLIAFFDYFAKKENL